MIHFFYRPNQTYLKKFPVSIFQDSFRRYDQEVAFCDLSRGDEEAISPSDSVFFYNLRYSNRKDFVKALAFKGVNLINKPRLNGKLQVANALQKAGVPSPRHSFVPGGLDPRDFIEGMSFPLVLKPAVGTSGGKGIHFCQDIDSLPEKAARGMIIQEYIMGARNHIVRINTVEDQSRLAMKVFTESGGPIINATSNGRVEAYTPTQEEVDVAVAGAKVLGVDIAGVDMAQTDEGPMIIEVNAVPGFGSGPKLGVEFHHFMVDLIVKRAREHEALTASGDSGTI